MFTLNKRKLFKCALDTVKVIVFIAVFIYLAGMYVILTSESKPTEACEARGGSYVSGKCIDKKYLIDIEKGE